MSKKLQNLKKNKKNPLCAWSNSWIFLMHESLLYTKQLKLRNKHFKK